MSLIHQYVLVLFAPTRTEYPLTVTFSQHFRRITAVSVDEYADALAKDGFVSLVGICTLSLEDLESGETAVRIPKEDRYDPRK